jgi:SnoaL-like domain
MTTATAADLRARRTEVVNQHIDAENRHDSDGVVASFDRPCYDIPPLGEAGQVNGAEAVRELWAGLIAGFPDVHIEAGRTGTPTRSLSR